MRSENNATPEQLWTSGLHSIASSDNVIAREVFEHIAAVSYTLVVMSLYYI